MSEPAVVTPPVVTPAVVTPAVVTVDAPPERAPRGAAPTAAGPARSRLRRRAGWAVALVAAIAAVALAAHFSTGALVRPSPYQTARVARGPLVAGISATGTLNAVITVQVGSQVSGQIKELFADFNSQVVKGQVIARIDPDIFQAQVNQAKAQLEAARAAVLNQRAALVKSRADLDASRAALATAHAQTAKARVAVEDGRRSLGRQQELRQRELVAQADLDAAQATYDSAVAQHEASQAQERAQASAVESSDAQRDVVEAQLQAAVALVGQGEAALRQAQVNLDHTVIRAPVDGVVVSRNVDVGQTVAASLQAPTLFQIAQDLTRMQVDTSVDEADVGRVRVGQAATFSVDSFPGRSFAGEVVQVRKAPQVVQNVVTYDVVVSAANPDLALLPGMTASVRIVTDQRADVLKVPNAALRFRPAEVSGEPPAGSGRPDARRGVAGQVWTLGPGGRPRAVPIRLGISDGVFTEVLAPETSGLGEQQDVITGLTVGPSPPGAARGPRLGI